MNYLSYGTPDLEEQDINTIPLCTPYEQSIISNAQAMKFLGSTNTKKLVETLSIMHDVRAGVPVDICHDMSERVIKILPVGSCILCPNSYIEKETDEHDHAGDQYVIRCAAQKYTVVASEPWKTSGLIQVGLDSVPTPASCPFPLIKK